VLILVVATLAGVGYLYLARGGSSANATGFLGANQQSVKAATTVITAARGVQRFTELRAFDLIATAQIHTLFVQRTTLQGIEAGASGRQKQIANEAVSSVQQAIDSADRYRRSVALTYRLNDANAAHQQLNNAIASLRQQAQAWQHS
jgi:murein L,D-transpeptidase YcbB/YkuD